MVIRLYIKNFSCFDKDTYTFCNFLGNVIDIFFPLNIVVDNNTEQSNNN